MHKTEQNEVAKTAETYSTKFWVKSYKLETKHY